MKKIRHLTVTVSYTVGLGNVEVSDEIYDKLDSIYDLGGEIPLDINEMEWINSTIKERDAHTWSYIIDEFE